MTLNELYLFYRETAEKRNAAYDRGDKQAWIEAEELLGIIKWEIMSNNNSAEPGEYTTPFDTHHLANKGSNIPPGYPDPGNR
jgi:hypothetical protein